MKTDISNMHICNCNCPLCGTIIQGIKAENGSTRIRDCTETNPIRITHEANSCHKNFPPIEWLLYFDKDYVYFKISELKNNASFNQCQCKIPIEEIQAVCYETILYTMAIIIPIPTEMKNWNGFKLADKLTLNLN